MTGGFISITFPSIDVSYNGQSLPKGTFKKLRDNPTKALVIEFEDGHAPVIATRILDYSNPDYYVHIYYYYGTDSTAEYSINENDEIYDV